MDKSFCRGNVSLFPAKNLFSARAAKKCPKNVPAKFQGCAIFVRGVFSKRSLNDDGLTFFLPKVFPESPLLKITCCCYGFMACPRDSMAIQLLAVQNAGHLSLSPWCGPVHDRDVDVHIGRKCVFHTSEALVTSFLTISFYVILLSPLLSA